MQAALAEGGNPVLAHHQATDGARFGATDLGRLGEKLHTWIAPLADGLCGGVHYDENSARAPDTIDATTDLPNHRSFRETLSYIRGQCRLLNEPIAMLLADLDGFCQLNEAHSHKVGDQVLRWIGGALRRRCRPSDFVARYDWDQFAVFLPGCTEAQALETALRCRSEWERRPPWLSLLPARISVSVGISSLGAGFIESEQTLIRMAGAAMAEAKRLGGDRTLGWSQIDSQDLFSARIAHGKAASPPWVDLAQDRVRRTYVESARALVAAVEVKDPYTRDHSLRVSHYAEGLARRLQLPAEQIDSLRTAAILHDIGKIGVPDHILCKPGPLTQDEYAVVKRHPAIAVEILGHASFFHGELPLILHHHEWFDGTGYPQGLAGEAIPFGARLLAVADCIDAMRSPRSYKAGYELPRVRQELKAFSGRQFDAHIAAVAAEWIATSPADFTHG